MIYAIFRTIGLTLGYPLQLFFFKRKTYYEDKKSTRLMKGGKLIITNHFNMFDYVLTSFVVYPRKLNVVASEMPFSKPIVRFGMKFFGAIQANRVTRSMKFMDECVRVITEKRQLVQIYPEARIPQPGEETPLPFKSSAAYIALESGAPIIPVYNEGKYFKLHRNKVIIGTPIDVRELYDNSMGHTENLENISKILRQRVIELKDELEEQTKAENKK